MAELQEKARLSRRLYGAGPAIFLVVLLVVIIGLFARVRQESDRLAAEKRAMVRKERPPVNVVVQEVVPRLVRDRLNLPGIVEPWVALDILAEVRGRVASVHVAEGDQVAKGDILVRLDSREYENALSAVKAAYDLALTDQKRIRGLYDQSLLSLAELDTVNARVKSLAAELKIAALQVERCNIEAPLAGVVNALPAKKGLHLSIADPVAKILDIQRLKAVIGIPESDVDAVRGLTTFELSVDALAGEKIQADKHFMSVAPESMAQLYRLEMAVANPDRRILPGMFVRVEVVKQEVADAVVIPLYAVISRDGSHFVYLDQAGRAVVREVELGILDGWQIQVSRGLAAGDRVVVVGQRNVDNGQQLHVVRTIHDPGEIVR